MFYELYIIVHVKNYRIREFHIKHISRHVYIIAINILLIFRSNDNQDFPKEDIYHIKMICMKLNEFLSLRIIDRRNISLRFSARNKNIRFHNYPR